MQYTEFGYDPDLPSEGNLGDDDYYPWPEGCDDVDDDLDDDVDEITEDE